MDKIAKGQMELIFRACGWYIKEEDQEAFLHLIKAMRALDVLNYRWAHFESLKAAEMIMERHGC